jgi:hypothetical protein
MQREEEAVSVLVGGGAPGRTRTCNLRTRSKTAPVRLVMAERIGAGRVGSAIHLVASRPAQ